MDALGAGSQRHVGPSVNQHAAVRVFHCFEDPRGQVIKLSVAEVFFADLDEVDSPPGGTTHSTEERPAWELLAVGNVVKEGLSIRETASSGAS
jgi:hypothetical protein